MLENPPVSVESATDVRRRESGFQKIEEMFSVLVFCKACEMLFINYLECKRITLLAAQNPPPRGFHLHSRRGLGPGSCLARPAFF